MARVQFSALLTGIQGSVGGSTFQKTKSGWSLKNKSIPVDSVTQKQSDARLFMSAVISLWQSLTDVQRNDWVLFANFYPQYTKENKSIALSGYQLFLKYNLIRLHCGYNPLVSIVYGVISKYSTTVAFYWENGDLLGYLDDSFDSELLFIQFFASGPKSSNYPIRAKSYKQLIPDLLFNNYFFLSNVYFTQFGYIPAPNLYIPYKISIMYLNMPVIQEGAYDSSVIFPN